MHSFSCGGGQSELPSMPSLTCRSSRSSWSKVIVHTSTTNGTRSPTDHSEHDDHAKLWETEYMKDKKYAVKSSIQWIAFWWKTGYTWPGPQEMPTMCLELRPGRALGCFLLEKSVSKCCSLSLLPQLCTSPSSVRARQCVEPTATSTTLLPELTNN